MTLIVEIEEFLKEARCHILDGARNEAFVMICVPPATTGQTRPDVVPSSASDLVPDDDDLITWEDAAWQ